MKHLIIFLTLLSATASTAQAIPAAPGLEGFGTNTPAGSGRHLSPPSTRVYKVTTLVDSGPGSLRECAEAQEPRTCVFAVGGYFNLTAPIEIKSPYLTIAGQTAPSPGVQLRNAGIRVHAPNVLIQHLGIRVGDKPGAPDPGSRDGIVVWRNSAPITGVVLDHLSITWGVDENASHYGSSISGVTWSHNILAEALHDGIHPEGKHSMGFLVNAGTTNLSGHHNLFAFNHDRNPRFKEGTTAEWINNVIYGYGGISPWNTANFYSAANRAGLRINFLGNFYRRGVVGTANPHGNNYKNPLPAIYPDALVPRSTHIFLRDNICERLLDGIGDPWDCAYLPERGELPRTMQADAPVIPLSGVEPKAPNLTWQYVLANAGARPWDRYPADERIVRETREGKGSIKDCMDCSGKVSVGGWPNIGSTSWEVTLPENPMEIAANGYTRLENWIFAFEQGGDTQPPTATPSATQTPTQSPTPDGSGTAVPTPNGTPSPTHSATPAATGTSTPVATATPCPPCPECPKCPEVTPTASVTPLPSPTMATTPAPTPKPTATPALPAGEKFKLNCVELCSHMEGSTADKYRLNCSKVCTKGEM